MGKPLGWGCGVAPCTSLAGVTPSHTPVPLMPARAPSVSSPGCHSKPDPQELTAASVRPLPGAAS